VYFSLFILYVEFHCAYTQAKFFMFLAPHKSLSKTCLYYNAQMATLPDRAPSREGARSASI